MRYINYTHTHIIWQLRIRVSVVIVTRRVMIMEAVRCHPSAAIVEAHIWLQQKNARCGFKRKRSRKSVVQGKSAILKHINSFPWSPSSFASVAKNKHLQSIAQQIWPGYKRINHRLSVTLKVQHIYRKSTITIYNWTNQKWKIKQLTNTL